VLFVWISVCFFMRGERGRVSRWALVWTGICLLPMLPALASKGLFGERYLYMAMVGFGISLACAFDRRPWLLLPLLLGWIVCTQIRIPDWGSDVRLWSSAVRNQPTPYSHGGLGNAFRAEGRDEDALSHFILAIDDPIPNLEVCSQLVGTALKLQDSWAAYSLGSWAELEKECGTGPRAKDFQAKMAVASAWTGHSEEAGERLGIAVSGGHDSEPLCSEVIQAVTQVQNGRSAHRLGVALEAGGYCGTTPGSFHSVMALASSRSGSVDEAIVRLRYAMQQNPVDGLCSEVIAALKQQGQSDAIAEEVSGFQETGCMSRGDAGVFAAELASSLALMGRWAEALVLLESAPTDPSGQDLVIRGAWALIQEDPIEYGLIRETMADSERYDRLVQLILEDATK
jgi:hypothetical protein